MATFLVTCMVGGKGAWSVNVYAPGFSDAATAGSTVITNLQKQVPSATLGDVWAYDVGPGTSSPGPDYLVTLTRASWTAQIYVENQPDAATAGSVGLTNLQKQIANAALSSTASFVPAADQGQLVRAN